MTTKKNINFQKRNRIKTLRKINEKKLESMGFTSPLSGKDLKILRDRTNPDLIKKTKPQKVGKPSARPKGSIMGESYGNRFKMDYVPNKRFKNGGMSRGGGAAIKGTKFEGVF